MTKKEETPITVIKWKLAERPTATNVIDLVKNGLITKEEARKIILDETEVTQSDIESIKNELALLRKMALELTEKSNNIPSIIKIIEKEQTPYRNPWQNPYITWTSSIGKNFLL